MRSLLIVFAILMIFPCMALATPVPDTWQTYCYDNSHKITCPDQGKPLYGQDAQYITNSQFYTKLDEYGNDLLDTSHGVLTEYAATTSNGSDFCHVTIPFGLTS